MSVSTQAKPRPPVYFLSIGGPNFIEQTDHPAYHELAKIGHEITGTVKPKAVVVFSAHWQAGRNTIQVNAAEETEQIYDFYGFPPHYYEYKYPSKGSPAIAQQVSELLARTGVKVEKVKRGLDHGVWAGFMAAFDPQRNPLSVPLVQVSLFDSDDFAQHYRLGQAVQELRDQGILIVGAGMAVHNLNDYRRMRASPGTVMPYSAVFDDALKEAVTSAPDARPAKMVELMELESARRAHPTVEHILPAFVAAGAAGEDVGERLYTFAEMSVNWAQYRFGAVQSA